MPNKNSYLCEVRFFYSHSLQLDGAKWCNETLVKAFQLKFACGNSGYHELLRQGFSFPSIRTLHRNKKLQK